MVKTILNKILENIGEIIFSGLVVIVGPIIKEHESICVSIVSRSAAYPRITVFGIALCVSSFAFIVYLLSKRLVLLKRKCETMEGRIAKLEDPMRNLILEGSTSIFKDTEKDRYICPKCFAKDKARSYLERVANDEYTYEAYTYLCHVCGFKTCDITGLDKYAAAEKAKSVEANRDALYAGGVYGCV